MAGVARNAGSTSKTQAASDRRACAALRAAQACAGTPDPAAAGVGLGGMVSGYLQTLESAAALNDYTQAEFVAFLELLNGVGRVSCSMLQLL